MATRTRKPANAGYLTKEPTAVHTAFAEYIGKTTGYDGITAEDVSLVQRLYPLYLKTPAVQKAREAERAAREAEKAAKDAEKRAKVQARLDKIEAQRQKLLAELGLEEDNVIDASVRFTPEVVEDDSDETDEESVPWEEEESEEVTLDDEEEADEDGWDDEEEEEEEDF